MKLFRWTVQVVFDPGRFFVPVTTSVYLSGITINEDRNMSVPQFSSINPVLYRRRHAKFLVRELKRAGYNAYKSSSGRFRNYATVVYPDSENTPVDWLSILEETKVPLMISPFHEFDVNPTGECKKPHYHVLVAFDGVKTLDQAKAIFDLVGGVGLETVSSLRGYARYLCHLDNPDKYQYPIEQVRCLGGADFHSIINLPTDKYKAIGEMIDYCTENGIYSYADLLCYCRSERFDWFRVLCDSGTLVMKEFLKSLEWTARQMRD